MTESAKNQRFSRLLRPALMIFGALAMAAAGAAAATWFNRSKTVSSEGNPAELKEAPQSPLLTEASESELNEGRRGDSPGQSEPHGSGSSGDHEIPDASEESAEHSDAQFMQDTVFGSKTAVSMNEAAGTKSEHAEVNDTDLEPAAESATHQDGSPRIDGPFPASEEPVELSENGGSIGPEVNDQNSAGNYLANADEKLRSGNYLRAQRDYQYLKDSASGPPGLPLQFRLALCSELAGNTSEALEAWRKIEANHSHGKWVGIATLGAARCLIALRRYDILQSEYLRPVLLDKTRLLPSVRAELLHLISRGQWAIVSGGDQQHLLHDESMVVPVWHPEPNQALDQASAILNEEYPPADKLQLTILNQADDTPDGIRLSIESSAGPAGRLLPAIVERCHLKCEISQQAAESMASRTLQIHVRNQSLSVLLDGLTIPFGNAWQFSGDVISVFSPDDADPEVTAVFRARSTERLLNLAMTEAPDVSHHGHTRIALGALLFREARVADATGVFRMQLESFPGSAVETEAAYDLGKCLLTLRSISEARDAFLLSVDSAGGLSEVRIAAYLYAARLQIEQGNPKRAVAILLRAVAISKGTSLEGDAALLLASAYLLLENPQRANDVLMERRPLLSSRNYQKASAFASALSRFQAVVLEDRREREARHLVAALAAFRPDEQFGSHWYLLYADAAERAGLTRQAEDAYVQALSREQIGPLRNQIVLRLAASYRARDRFEEATSLLASLTPEESGTFATMASLRAAEVALQLGQTSDAIRHCRQLLSNEITPEIQRATLRIMGHAFEREGNHLSAVKCFSGVVPSESMDKLAPASGRTEQKSGTASPNPEALRGLAPAATGGAL